MQSLTLTQPVDTLIAIRNSEEQLRLVVDNLPVCIAYMDRNRQDGLVNRTYEEWFRFPRAGMEGSHVWDVIGSEAYEAVRREVDAALAGHEVSYEREMPYRTGSRWTSTRLVPHRADGREVLDEMKADPHLRRIPVVVRTSSAAERDIVRAYDLYANCYVTKPVDLDQFITVVESVEGFRLTVVGLPPNGEDDDAV